MFFEVTYHIQHQDSPFRTTFENKATIRMP